MTAPTSPSVGVGGVVVDAGRVLLIKRGKPPLYGRWVVPGGTVELGESLEQALVREVREETGLEVRPRAFLTAFERIVREDGAVRHHFVILDYLCERVSGDVSAASDALEARFVAPQDLERHALPPKALEVILDGLRSAGVPLPSPLPRAGPAE
ncbi:MAG TPA: NUDIX hydrolase [Vicinamibacteria bacterium]|nr:NUDIX hydrolase [Vicinamibacteria bacterium]